jgi:hypothetical protein
VIPRPSQRIRAWLFPLLLTALAVPTVAAGRPVSPQLVPDALTAPGEGPAARDAHTAIYDSLDDRLIVFGGWDRNTNFNDLWALSLAGTPTWTQLTPAGTPPSGRRFQSVIYDPARHRMVMFGGYTGETYVNEVWALSLDSTLTWTMLTPAGTPPHERYRQTTIYDPVQDRMIMFGGWWSGINYNDVWALSLDSTLTWTELTPEGVPPKPRYSHTAVYDPIRGRMVVFGGVEDGFFHDTWALSLGATPAWTELTPEDPLPHSRYVHSAIYDAVRDRMVVFGGYDGEIYRNDAWALSLGGVPAWTQLQPVGELPGGRFGHTAVYDAVHDRMVTFGGFSDPTFFNDVWGLSLGDTTAWAPLVLPGLSTLIVHATHGNVTQDPLPNGGTYAYGTPVLLTAIPDPGYRFMGYHGDVEVQTDTVTIVMAGDRSVTADFAPDSVTLTIAAVHGAIVASPPSVDGRYVIGTPVLLTATADAGYHFLDFHGDVEALTDTVTVTMAGDHSVTADFAPDSVSLTVNTANGSVAESPLASDGRYAYGTAVLLTATPVEGYGFLGFSGDVEAQSDTVTVIMTGDRMITATFQASTGVGGARPSVTVLMPAMPNPFQRSATLAFALARGGAVRLAVYGVDGRRVRTLVDGAREPGQYRAGWDGRDDAGQPVPAGVYYARLEAPDRAQSRMVLRLR